MAVAPPVQGDPAHQLRQFLTVGRRAIAAVHELEREAGEQVARYRIAPDRSIDEELLRDLASLLQLARSDRPDETLHVTVRARPRASREDPR